MEKETIEMFKNILQDQLNDLTVSFERTVSWLARQENLPPDSLDQPYEEMEGFLIRIKDREGRVINKIKKALARVEDSSFGICELCGGEIEIERLMERPVATHCIKCKLREEQLEAIFGN